MILLVGGATATLKRFPQVGAMVQPRAGNSIDLLGASGRAWAADNDCFQGLDVEAYWRMLRRIAAADRSHLLWVTVPDVVGNAQATVNRWVEWFPQLEYLELPAAFVGQDGIGAIRDQIPWDDLACVFLGGTTAWKLGPEAEWLAREAKARGKWVHMGRVNSLSRIRHALALGCDSIDGTQMSRWPDEYIPKMLRWVRQTRAQGTLF